MALYATDPNVASTLATAIGGSPTGLIATVAGKVAKGDLVYNVKDYGAAGDGVADDTSEIQAAITAAAAGGTVYFPAGTYKLTSDVTVSNGSVTLRGAGDASDLRFTGGGLVFNGTAGYLGNVGLHDLRIVRAGSAGAALRFKGAGGATGVVHLNATNVRVYGSTAECLLIDGSYVGTFTGCYFVAGVTGIKVAFDSVAGNVTGNNISFFGGETQACGTAVSLDTPLSVNFYGHAFEGSTTAGVDVFGNGYGCGFYGCYWEANAAYDLRVGNSGSIGPIGLNVHGGIALDGAIGKTYAFRLIRGQAIDIRGVGFGSYSAAPISVAEASAGAVRGEARNNSLNGNPASATIALNGATLFNKVLPQVDVFTSSGTYTMPSSAVSLDVAVIAGGAGGGSGRRGLAGTVRCGGGGGGGGTITRVTIPAAAITSPVTVTVGAGGAGGAAVTADSTDGAAGVAGGTSSFGTYARGSGGAAGAGGTATTGTGGVAQTAGMFASAAGGSASGSGGVGGTGGSASGGAGGGGSGGGITSGDAASAGGAGGTTYAHYSGGAVGAGGAIGTIGSVGTAAPANSGLPGNSSGGGGSSVSGAAGAGAAGSIYGTGGGGGGASLNGNNSGVGGAGAAGIVVVVTYFN